MKSFAIATIALVVAGASYWAVSPEKSPPPPQQPESTVVEPLAKAKSAPAVLKEPTSPKQSQQAAQLGQRVDTLEKQLHAVILKRQTAEAALAQAEYDVTELERHLEEIKVRGEDPTDYADEGMDRFLPAFEAYQSAYEEREASVNLENEIRAELALAKRSLANE